LSEIEISNPMPVVMTTEAMEFYAEHLLYKGLREVEKILDAPRVRVSRSQDKVILLETTPENKIKALSAVVAVSKLVAAKKVLKQKKELEIPDDYRITNGD
jgi:hypothetical protein